MRHVLAAIPVVLVFGGIVLGQSAPAKGPARPPATTAPAKPTAIKPVPDLCKGPIEPYDVAGEKARFFAVAGVDSELSEKEFAANKGKPKAFVRVFDKWQAVAGFDKDKNKTIDWLEADAYRRAFGKRVLAAFDTNKDKRLKGAERDAANRALAEGKISLPVKPAPRTIRGPMSRQGMRQYDRDGDGEISDEERAAMREAWRAGSELRRFDADGDGKLNEAEAGERDKARAETEKRRAEFIKKYDEDGDGRLSREERSAARRAEREERRKRTIEEFDADGDGKLSETERRAARQAQRERMRRGMRQWRQRMELRRSGADAREPAGTPD